MDDWLNSEFDQLNDQLVLFYIMKCKCKGDYGILGTGEA